MVKEVWSIMTFILPITCRQLGYLIMVGMFITGNVLLIQSDYSLKPFDGGFFGWLLVAFSVIFGLISIFIYIDDHQLIRCKCDK